jgi:hypothetical protein
MSGEARASTSSSGTSDSSRKCRREIGEFVRIIVLFIIFRANLMLRGKALQADRLLQHISKKPWQTLHLTAQKMTETLFEYRKQAICVQFHHAYETG